MKRFAVLCGFAVSVLISGCMSYYRDSGVDYLEQPKLAAGTPYYTEYDVSETMVSAKGEAALLFGMPIGENKHCLFASNPNQSMLTQMTELLTPTYRAVLSAKSIALYNACVQHNADRLLGATFDYVVTDYLLFTKVDCTVKGFPAKVKGVKMVDKKPIIINKWQKIEYIAPHEVPEDFSGEKPEASFSVFDSVK